MRRSLIIAVATAAVLLGTGGSLAANAAPPAAVTEVTLSGPVDPLLARYVTRALHAATRDGRAAVLVRIDTPGGLDSSMREIVKAIGTSPVPVVCWVGPSGARAASAGAFVLLGCPVAAMAPGTNVGAAHPVGITGRVMSEKVTNDAAAYLRSLAERWGRNGDWAERAVRQSVSASANQARDLRVVDIVASSRSSLLADLDGRTVKTGGGDVVLHISGARVDGVHPTPAESVLHSAADPNLAFVFLLVGLALVIFSLFHPGLHLGGVAGLALLVLSLMILGMLPVTLGGLALLLAADGFFALSVKLHGHGVPQAAGVVCMVLGGLFLFSPDVPNARVSLLVIGVFAVVLTAFFTFVVRAALRTRYASTASGQHLLLGHEAVVVKDLDPKGIVHVRGEAWTAVSAHGPVPKGARVRIVALNGLTLEVVPEPAALEVH